MSNFTEKSYINQQLTQNFQSSYLRMVRTGPGVLGFKPIKGSFYEKHFTNDAQALALIAANGGQADTWVSMATYADPNTSRSQENAEGLCALWIDVDAHQGSKYDTVEEVQAAVQGFLFHTGLPKPTLIHLTGYGVHAIWAFTEVIKREEWQPVADKLQELAERMFLGADPITADAARILRVPGTLNFRDSENPKLAMLEKTGFGLHGFDDIASAIDQALSKFPALVKTLGNGQTAKVFIILLTATVTRVNSEMVSLMAGVLTTI